MTEAEVSLDLEVRWEPNSDDQVLSSNESGRSVLVLNPHFDDDQRKVVLVFDDFLCVAMPP